MDTSNRQSAIVIAAAARLNARVAGMQAENHSRDLAHLAPAYDEQAFIDAIESEECDYNSVLMILDRL